MGHARGPVQGLPNASVSYVASICQAGISFAASASEAKRRRVHNETLGHRGRKADPLYRCRRLLTKADERLTAEGKEKRLGLPLPRCSPAGSRRPRRHSS